MPQTISSAFNDTQRLRPGAEEELAGSARSSVEPTTRRERIAQVDVVRGVAILGILILNIASMSGQGLAEALLWPGHAARDWHSHLNLVLYFLQFTFVYGKMRGLLSMLLGAGVVLMISRIERREGRGSAAPRFFRRNLGMIIIGLLHGYLVYDGDFIFPYAVISILLLYACRGLRARTLLIAGVLITVVGGTFCYLAYTHTWDTVLLAKRSATATAHVREGVPATEAERRDLQAWQREMIPLSYDAQKVDARIRQAQRGFPARFDQTPATFFSQEMFRVMVILGDSGGMMLMGMALFKMGFLTGELSDATYLRTAILGFLASVPLSLLGLFKAKAAGFAHGAVACWMYLPFKLTNVGATLAILSCLLLLIKKGVFQRLFKYCAAVGQTALTSYVFSNIICQILFSWGPIKLYGRVDYFQMCCCVLAIWLVNLAMSTIWMRYFAFGPLEWALRSFTYWRSQPLRAIN